MLDNPELGIAELIELVPGPDFPTAGLVYGVQGVFNAYKTGRGKVYIRARTHIEPLDKKGREAIVITELPYQVNKARLIEKIAELVREKRLEGITELRDESDKDGLRVVIELGRGEISDVVLNNLFKHTQLESVFGINMVALLDGQPRLLNLRSLLEAFLRHRREVITRRTLYQLRKARERAHVLEGQTVALANIDEVIALIRGSSSPAEAREGLMGRIWPPGQVVELLERAGADATRPENQTEDFGLENGIDGVGYRLSRTQAQAILDLRLHRLTALEQDKITKEYGKLVDRINELIEILANPDRLLAVMREELTEVRDRYADERRTEIVEDYADLTIEDLIPQEDLVVTLSHGGYAKAQPLTTYQAQRRGGRGRAATRVKEEDFVDQLFVANSHDTLLCFSSRGKVYWLKVYRVPQASPGARGRPIVNLLPLEQDERINAVLPISEFEDDRYVFFATSRGRVKKTPLSAFSRPLAPGIIAVGLRGNDHLIGAGITDGDKDIMLFSRSGKAIRFQESDVRPMGRTAAGVRGLKLKGANDAVIDLCIPDQDDVLVATENGYGKRTAVDAFPVHKRGGQGTIAIQTTQRNGPAVGALRVGEEDEIMFISSSGTLVRTMVSEISVLGRIAQGVRLIRLDEGARLVGMERIESLQESLPAE